MGPYNIDIRTAENCGPKSGEGLVFDPHIKKINRSTFILDAAIQTSVDYDDSMTLLVDMALFTNNGWKENYYKQSFPKACTVTKFWGGELFKELMKRIGVKARCPIPKGNYTVKGWMLKLEVPSIPVWYYNKYRWRGTVSKDGHTVGCLGAIVDVVPKKNH
ncbi:hypothetical protein GE061_014925 [Apolygus lucorum]|uniref:MD-2-related lipid-recognition domain-containing protein n=1 Tax=Apolygus lucorum TaxID=248454 RepID=A0A8S9XJE9_APOLU|nr:hypothetical protein GE061_014925 [Apolygus lucorum]